MICPRPSRILSPRLIISPSAEEEAVLAQAALSAAAVPLPDPPQQSAVTEESEQDPDSTSITPSVQTVNTAAKVAKKVVKKKLTAKERRERGVPIQFLDLVSGSDMGNSSRSRRW